MENLDQTDFGFRKVSPQEKTRLVTDVFHRVAQRYDFMNDAMSLGVHRLWKDCFVRKMKSPGPQHLLDVAGGTGDIAFRFLKQSLDHQVTLCDINTRMIEVGRDRALNQGHVKKVQWTCGDAETLPFEDNSFDLYSIAFGLRNVTRRSEALQEAYRVLKPGGRFFCLEFSQVQVPVLKSLYQIYSFSILPRLGAILAQDRDAYQYLVESIAQFPSQEHLKQELQEAGFKNVQITNLSGGIVAIHQAIKEA